MRLVSLAPPVFLALIAFGLPSYAQPVENYLSGIRSTNPHYQESPPPENTVQSRPEPEFDLPEGETENPRDEPLETDRHDFTQSPRVVGRGVLQLEYGLFYAYKEVGTERESTFATPEVMIRYGLNDWLEFRTRWNYAWKFNNEEDDLDSAEDLRFSFKIQVSEGRCYRPESALELRMTAPTGGNAFTTGRVETGFDYIYAWDLGEYFTLAGSTGANTNALGDVAYFDTSTDRGDHFALWTQSVALGAKLTRRSTGYFECFGLFTHGREDNETDCFLNFGLDYLLNNNTVIDFRVGWGLTEDSDDLFAGIGGGLRF